jgi:hypothetical protein
MDLTRPATGPNSSPRVPTDPSNQNITPPVTTDVLAAGGGSGSGSGSGPRRETVRQGAAAWSNVSKNPGTPTITQKTGNSPRVSVTSEDENAFRDAVEALNQKRTENGHAGTIGTGRLPYTEKEPQRRMMVVICGEGRDKAAISEVNR